MGFRSPHTHVSTKSVNYVDTLALLAGGEGSSIRLQETIAGRQDPKVETSAGSLVSPLPGRHFTLQSLAKDSNKAIDLRTATKQYKLLTSP